MAPADAPGMEVRDAPVEGALGPLLAPTAGENAPHRDGLARGRLVLRRCGSCSRPRYPHGPVCPRCGSDRFEWDELAPAGSVHAWIRYRRSFLLELEALVPYTVISAELDDGGVRIFGRLLEPAPEPHRGMRVRGFVERWADGAHMLAFEATEGEQA